MEKRQEGKGQQQEGKGDGLLSTKKRDEV
jgi:hypothetical protein